MNGFSHPEEPPVIPDHTLVRRIGAGSYGSIWLARTVMGVHRAVKVVYRANFDSDRPYQREFEGIQQFEPISRSHPGLVDVLQIGRNDVKGYFYYIMELADCASGAPQCQPATYVPRTLSEDLNMRGRLPAAEALEHGRRLAAALAHLHQRGLAHRDIKPSNIIFVNAEPKLADIGLVAPVRADATHVGTDGYIPPEGPTSLRADIFSLGKVLYEMATGQPRADFPTLPHDLERFPDRELMIELNEVALKACAPEPGSRHADADELRAELDLLLAGRSVRHIRKVERQVRVAWQAAGVAAVLALLALGYGVVNGHLREREARLLAEAYVRDGTGLMEDRELHRALAPLAAALRLRERDPVATRTLRTRVGTALQAAPRLLQSWKDLGVLSDVRFSPGGTRLLVAGGRRAAVLDIETRTVERTFDFKGQIETAVFSPDGLTIAVANGDDVTVASLGDTNVVNYRAQDHVNSAEFSPDGQSLLIACADGAAYLLNATNQARRHKFAGHSNEVCYAAFSPDGTRIVTAGRDGTARLWDASTGESLGPPLVHAQWLFAAAFSPDGRHVATASSDGTVRVWNVQGGLALATRIEHRAAIRRVSYSPDGRFILSAGWDHTARLWDAHTGEPAGAVLRLHTSTMQAVFDADARRLATAGADGEVKVWLLRASAPKNVGPLAMVSENGSTYVTVSSNEVRFWNATNDQALTPPVTLPDTVAKGVANQDGSRVVVQLHGEQPPWAVLQTVSREGLLPSVVLSDRDFWVVNPAGTRLLSRDDRVLRGWNLDTGEVIFESPALPMTPGVAAFAPNGRSVAVASKDKKRILVLEADTGRIMQELQIDPGVKSLAFSPDSRRLAAAAAGTAPFSPCEARLWDLASGALIGLPMVHTDAIRGARFSHDGRSLVTYGYDQRAAVWTTDAARPVMDPILLSTYVESAAFSADSLWLITASSRQVQVWNARTGQAVTPPFTDAVPFNRAGFCAGGRRIWTATRRGVLLWDLPEANGTPDELMALADHLGAAVPATLNWNPHALTAAQLDERCAQERRAAAANLPAWRASQIEHAEARDDWFAAQFHLEKLLQTTPNDTDLRRRMEAARERLAAPAP